MSELLKWDEAGKRLYEAGVERGILFPQAANGTYPTGVAWNGLISVTESPSGAEANPLYADNIKYVNLMSTEELGATIEAFTYPEEFEACDGSAELAVGVSVGQQSRTPFGMSYKTRIGNDTEGDAHGYKLHLLYGAQASPSEKAYQTINDSPEAITFSWDVTTTPIEIPGMRPSSKITIDSTKVDAAKLTALEVILYGTAATTEPVVAAIPARLPLPAEVASIFAAG